MIAKGLSVFNTASPADSDNVGAFLRDTSGNTIDSKSIAAAQWLNVASALYDGAGTAITSTGGAIDINVKSGTIDVGVADKTTYTYGTTVFQPVGGVFQDTSPALTAGQSGAARLTANRAVHSNLRDASGNELLGQKAMAASVPVVIASDQASFAVTTNDIALANSAATATAASVANTEGAILGAQAAGRKYMFLYNNGTKAIYLGPTGVTTASGFPLFPGAAAELRLGPAVSLHAISASGTQDVRTLELA